MNASRGFLRRALQLVCGIVALFCTAHASAITCTVSATTVAFGNYNPFSYTPNTSTGAVSVTCDPVIAALLFGYTVQLSAGSSTSFASRYMANGASHLNYQLYQDLLNSTVWGDGTGGSSVLQGFILLSVLAPVTNVHTVFGTIPARQTTAKAGAFTDSINVLVIY